MGVAIYDAVDDVLNMMDVEWNYDNADIPKPRFTRTWEEKATGIIDDLRDVVIITPETEKVEYFSLYGRDHLHYPVITLDIRGFNDEERHREIVDHIDKILKAQVRRTNFVDLRITATRTLSQNYRNMFRHIIEITYRKLNP